MQHTIGKLVLFCLVIGQIFSSQGTISWHITDNDGTRISQIVVGTPFVIEIKSDQQLSAHQISFEKQPFKILHQRSSSSVRVINTSVERNYSYQYTVCIDTIGTHVVGPANIVINGQKQSTQPLTIEVVTASATKNDVGQSTITVTVHPERTNCVVGEKIPCTLQCTFSDDITIQSLQMPQTDLASIVLNDKPEQNIEHHGAQRFITLTWHGFIFPQKKGKLSASYIIHYAVAKPKKSSNLWNVFWQGLQPLEERQQSSNALVLSIDPLPTSNIPISFVGTLTNASLTLQQSSIEQHKATVLTLSLQGAGNFEAATCPQLVLPDFCKYYPSKNYQPSAPEKCFEYVIQATTAGQWEISAQEIAYFDTKDRCCKVITTNSLPLRILPKTVAAPNQQKIEPITAEENDPAKVTEISPLRKVSLPINWFIIFCALPLLWLIFGSVWRYSNNRWQLKKNVCWWHTVFTARRMLKRAAQQQQPEKIYDIFIKIYPDHKTILPAQVAKGQEHAWQEFWHQVLQQKFSKDAVAQNTLFAQAADWLNMMEKNI